ncbi:helix-turn-helix domain-containing protein [Allorhizobium terrae]|uniref:Helix-turn-helix transcriptional regulator n=1 Tax=Allorhizobium terrae TaxID=1848972 RepID=A0A4S4A1G9_9HYPH|nr:helix-turn-helix transcriptional regulator [Allorhizobium terrae]THF52177.1 helix-turn-helix transcriptional regulator [Allorhizobium terrae]TWD57635.1 helix-turn-helix protein [Agrobacterium vitis]
MTRFDIRGLFRSSHETFGDRLNVGRDLAGLEFSDLAVAANVSERTLRAWEAGKSNIDGKSLEKVAALLNVSSTWLLTGEGVGPQAQNENSDMINFMRWELERLTRLHQETAEMIDMLHRQIGDLEQNASF